MQIPDLLCMNDSKDAKKNKCQPIVTPFEINNIRFILSIEMDFFYYHYFSFSIILQFKILYNGTNQQTNKTLFFFKHYI